MYQQEKHNMSLPTNYNQGFQMVDYNQSKHIIDNAQKIHQKTDAKDVSTVKNDRTESLQAIDRQLIERMTAVLHQFNIKQTRIVEIVDRWMLTREDLSKIATDLGVMSYDQSLQAMSLLSNIPLIEMQGIEPHPSVIGLAKSGKINMDTFYGYVPLGMEDNKLVVAVSSPDTIQVASARFSVPIKIKLMSEYEIIKIYRKHFSNTKQRLDELLDLMVKNSDESEARAREFLMLVIKHCAYNNVSDIHMFKSLQKLGIIQVTMDGVSSLLKTVPEKIIDSMINMLISDNNKNADIAHSHCSGTVKFEQSDVSVVGEEISRNFNFRVQIGNTSNNIGNRGKTVTIRLLPKSAQTVSLKHLGYSPKSIADLTEVSGASAGLFLVVGPTGSGKSTTLYSLMSSIDPIERSIQTIENPIEYEHGAWKQYTLLGGESGKTEGQAYAEILKSLLRQAPKVILVGEIRDYDVAYIAAQAANTGHMVYATLHANTSTTAVNRMISMGMDKEDIALIIKGVLAQRLVRTLCPHCKERDHEHDEYVLSKVPHGYDGTCEVYKASHQGCPSCKNTGYSGRKIVHELMVADEKVREAIASGKNMIELERIAFKESGQPTIAEDAFKLVAQGLTSIEEVKRSVL